MTEQTNHQQQNSKQYLYIALTLILLAMGITMIYRHFNPATNTPKIAINTNPAVNVINENDDHQPEDATLNEIIDKQDNDFVDENDAEELTQGTDEVLDDIIPSPKRNTIENKPRASANTHTRTLNEDVNTNQPSTKYMVLTGSFGAIENARKRLEQTIGAGYRNAEIVQFDHSKFQSVCALRTDSRADADVARKKLKTKGIDALIHTRK